MSLGTALGHSAVYAAVGLGILYLGWLMLDLITPGRLGKKIFEEQSIGAAVVAAAAQIGLAAVVFTAIWTNGGGMNDGLLWTAIFGVVGVALQVASFFVLDLLTPGKLGEAITSKGFHPGALLAAGGQLGIAAIVCASIA